MAKWRSDHGMSVSGDPVGKPAGTSARLSGPYQGQQASIFKNIVFIVVNDLVKTEAVGVH